MKVLLSGYFGFGNTGDEMIHSVLMRELLNKGFEVASLVKQSHNSTEFDRSNYKSVINAISSTDVLISGGGGLLQDATSSKSLYYYLSVIYYAKKVHKKTVVLAQGIGPIKGRLNLHITKSVLKQADLITVRDLCSYRMISRDVDPSKIYVTADLGFMFDSEQEIALPYKDYVVFTPAASKHMPSLNDLVRTAYTINRKTNKQVVLLPLFPEFDGELVNSISSMTKMPVFSPSNLLQTAFFIKNAYLVVGTRYHSIVLSSLKRVPFVALSYDMKVSNLANEFAEKAFPYENLASAEFEQSLDELLFNYNKKKAAIDSKIKELQHRAEENFEILYRLLSTK